MSSTTPDFLSMLVPQLAEHIPVLAYDAEGNVRGSVQSYGREMHLVVDREVCRWATSAPGCADAEIAISDIEAELITHAGAVRGMPDGMPEGSTLVYDEEGVHWHRPTHA
jgi:hypothetical protein